MKTIQYIYPDVIVCLNGEIKIPEQKYKKSVWVAADGAANTLMKKGIVPSYIIGDLDSVSDDLLCQTNWVKISEQETCDFEKVLQFILKKGWESVAILGFQGKDLDHTLNNWSVLMRYGQELQLCVVDNGKQAVPLYSACRLKYKSGLLVSLIPQTEVTITTHGLQWELQSDHLKLGQREGARNTAIQDDITIDINEGSVLLVLENMLEGKMPSVTTTNSKNSDRESHQ